MLAKNEEDKREENEKRKQQLQEDLRELNENRRLSKMKAEGQLEGIAMEVEAEGEAVAPAKPKKSKGKSTDTADVSLSAKLKKPRKSEISADVEEEEAMSAVDEGTSAEGRRSSRARIPTDRFSFENSSSPIAKTNVSSDKKVKKVSYQVPDSSHLDDDFESESLSSASSSRLQRKSIANEDDMDVFNSSRSPPKARPTEIKSKQPVVVMDSSEQKKRKRIVEEDELDFCSASNNSSSHLVDGKENTSPKLCSGDSSQNSISSADIVEKGGVMGTVSTSSTVSTSTSSCEWSCSSCTFINNIAVNSVCCEICG